MAKKWSSKTVRWPTFYKMNLSYTLFNIWIRAQCCRKWGKSNWKICRGARRWQLACLGHSSAIAYIWFLDRIDNCVSIYNVFVPAMFHRSPSAVSLRNRKYQHNDYTQVSVPRELVATGGIVGGTVVGRSMSNCRDAPANPT
jgi:hypothetical protein